MGATLIKTLKLKLNDAQYECQLNTAEVTDEPDVETVETFCGPEDFPTANYKLHLAGFQDWVDVDGVCDIIHDAYIADPVILPIDFEVMMGDPAATPSTAKYRSGQAKPTSDMTFGGQAGSPLTFDVTLDIDGVPDETPLA